MHSPFRKKNLPFFCAALLIAGVFIWAFSGGNNPWPKELVDSNTLFTSITQEIKTLDPGASYFEHEGVILDNLVEMPLEYDYLARPYRLVPMLFEEIPKPIYLDAEGNVISEDAPAEQVHRVEYLCKLKRQVYYQPHPCFGETRREMKAMDFQVALERICDTKTTSPIFSTFSSFLLGMDETSQAIQEAGDPDYRFIPLPCVEILDDYTFKLILKRKYPQVLYWMAMHFFSPIPYEAVVYFREEQSKGRAKGFHNSPIGTGPFYLKEFDPNTRIILERNPNYSGTPSPLSPNAGLSPFLDRLYYFYERETVPGWIKFLNGYYDLSEIPNDSFDNAMSISAEGALGLSPEMQARGISLLTSVRMTTYYYGFNMLDPIVGGLTPEKKKLRQAISIALDTQEEVDLFRSGRGVVAQGLLPPGLPGGDVSREHYNKFVFDWNENENAPVRKSLAEAKRLLAEAGYPNGIGPDGKRLAISYDHSGAGNAGFKSQFLWIKGRFAQLGIDLLDNGTDLNRFRDKILTGNFQMFYKGWVADYPDPENFLFLFHSPNAHALTHGNGSNYTNYQSPEFDELFLKLETMENSPEREALIWKAQEMLQEDAPCVWSFHPTSFTLVQPWLKDIVPHEVGKTFSRFRILDPELRKRSRPK